MTVGAASPDASHTLYCVAPGTLLQWRSNGAMTAGAPSTGAGRMGRTSGQLAGGAKVKRAWADSTASQPLNRVRMNHSMLPAPTVRRSVVALVLPAKAGLPLLKESHSS